MARLVAGVTALLTLAVVACSGDDDADPTTPTGAAPASTVAVPTSPAPSPATSERDGTAPAPPSSGSTATTTASSTAGPTTFPTPTGEDPRVTATEVARASAAVHLAWRPGDDAMYVVEQGGTIQRVLDGEQTAVLDLGGQITDTGEQGLLSVAFAAGGDLAYIAYTDLDGAVVIDERTVDEDGTFGDDGRELLRIPKEPDNHNGGTLVFGPDGYLYFGMGDGGGDGTQLAPDPGELFGKLLRIDPTPSGDEPYTVPADNPFVGEAGARPEVWSTGLRNPWKYSFDRQTGDLWIGDVGESEFEEISVGPATGGRDGGKGLYFGWGALEGDARFNEAVSAAGATPPFTTYGREEGRCASVVGGVRSRGDHVPDLAGWYVYSDGCAGEIWALEVLGEGTSMEPGRQLSIADVEAVTSIAEGPDGAVYATSHWGPIVRLDPA